MDRDFPPDDFSVISEERPVYVCLGLQSNPLGQIRDHTDGLHLGLRGEVEFLTGIGNIFVA